MTKPQVPPHLVLYGLFLGFCYFLILQLIIEVVYPESGIRYTVNALAPCSLILFLVTLIRSGKLPRWMRLAGFVPFPALLVALLCFLISIS
jgi:hypothetical protein